MQRTNLLCAVVVGFLASFMAVGCGIAREYTRVEIYGMKNASTSHSAYPVFISRGESVTINNPRIVEKLSSFFPGLGSGRRPFLGCLVLNKEFELVFYDKTGYGITVYTQEYMGWGSYDASGNCVDCPPLELGGDIQSYLEALFTSVEVQKTTRRRPGSYPIESTELR